MDFSKLNLEFNNMQVIITKYNEMQLMIRNRIKSNNKEISKFDNKIKNTKNSLEKESYKLVILAFKNENMFLEDLLKEEANNGQKPGVIKTI